MTTPEKVIDLNLHLLRGIYKLLLLSVLNNSKNGELLSGYSIIQSIKEISEDKFQLKAGTIYPILDDLVTNNYIELMEIEPDKGRRKKYTYKINENGVKFLPLLWEEWEQLISEIDRFSHKKLKEVLK